MGQLVSCCLGKALLTKQNRETAGDRREGAVGWPGSCWLAVQQSQLAGGGGSLQPHNQVSKRLLLAQPPVQNWIALGYRKTPQDVSQGGAGST